MALAPLARGSSSPTAAETKESCQHIVSAAAAAAAQSQEDLPLKTEEVGGETVKVVKRYSPPVLKRCNVAERW